MEDLVIKQSIDIFRPVMESAVVISARYATAAGREVVTGDDMRYAMRYSARYLCGKHIGSLFPDIYEEDTDDEDEDEDEDEDDNPFVRYTGEDQLMNEINTCFDTWDDWVPECKAQKMIKNAIDKEVEEDGC